MDQHLDKKQAKLYIVALTERYEVPVIAYSRQQAIDAVDSFGGSSPTRTTITASLAKEQWLEQADIDATGSVFNGSALR